MRLLFPATILLSASLLLGAAPQARAQRGLYFGVQTGPGLSRNQTRTDHPLAGGVRTFSHLSFAFNGTLTYRFNEHYALEGAAGWYLTHDGLRYGYLVYDRDPEGNPAQAAGAHSSVFPVRQLRLHGLRYLPFAHGKLAGVLGAGGTFVWGRFREYDGFGSYYEAGRPEQEYVRFRMEPTTMRQAGFLLGGQVGLEWRPNPRNTLALTAQYHLGVSPIYAARTTDFVYSDAYRGVVDYDQQATFVNRGSYGVITLGYQRRLWAH